MQIELQNTQCWYGYLEKGSCVRLHSGRALLRNLSAEISGLPQTLMLEQGQPQVLAQSGWMLIAAQTALTCTCEPPPEHSLLQFIRDRLADTGLLRLIRKTLSSGSFPVRRYPEDGPTG